eukprot:TRINITY_DN2691_c0_g2_i4.p1 TRINITY_DN2691_c0_g2~~TRINITY_DN2691_c0_g2_i4.p1  ORF type:complete len:444 (+),score=97.31 TRINITY_DN2691_c0_g2_i4:129-1460(+)
MFDQIFGGNKTVANWAAAMSNYTVSERIAVQRKPKIAKVNNTFRDNNNQKKPEPIKPFGPVNPYVIFVSKTASENDRHYGKSGRSEAWKALSENEKQRYRDEAENNKKALKPIKESTGYPLFKKNNFATEYAVALKDHKGDKKAAYSAAAKMVSEKYRILQAKVSKTLGTEPIGYPLFKKNNFATEYAIALKDHKGDKKAAYSAALKMVSGKYRIWQASEDKVTKKKKNTKKASEYTLFLKKHFAAEHAAALKKHKGDTAAAFAAAAKAVSKDYRSRQAKGNRALGTPVKKEPTGYPLFKKNNFTAEYAIALKDHKGDKKAAYSAAAKMVSEKYRIWQAKENSAPVKEPTGYPSFKKNSSAADAEDTIALKDCEGDEKAAHSFDFWKKVSKNYQSWQMKELSPQKAAGVLGGQKGVPLVAKESFYRGCDNTTHSKAVEYSSAF